METKIFINRDRSFTLTDRMTPFCVELFVIIYLSRPVGILMSMDDNCGKTGFIDWRRIKRFMAF